jgi:PAS domain S-box-containing protein
VVAISPNGILTYCSPILKEFGGYTPEDEIGEDFRKYFADKHELAEANGLIQNLETNQQSGSMEFMYKPKGKDPFPVEISARPLVRNGKIISYQCVLRDITQRRQTEQKLQRSHDDLERKIDERTKELKQTNEKLTNEIEERLVLQNKLIQSERLAATGQLAASVAHEINSPLQAVTVMLDTIRNKYKDDNHLSNHIDLLKGAFQNIRDTVKNLLDLNRPGKDKKHPTQINHIIEKTVKLTRGHLKKNKVAVHLDLFPDLPEIEASPQQLNHVFLNIINNAVEAISEAPKKNIDVHYTGKITIQTDLMEKDIIIKFIDTGHGISKKDLKHLFDPFFTTKKQFGMGIGLSICHGIIEDHNGTLAVNSSTETGTMIKISLPI